MDVLNEMCNVLRVISSGGGGGASPPNISASTPNVKASPPKMLQECFILLLFICLGGQGFSFL